jgi:hypothetical protein
MCTIVVGELVFVLCAPSMWRTKVWSNREGAMRAIHVSVQRRKVRRNNPFLSGFA